MINPTKVTNFDRSDFELEVFWLFCLMVAGKNADVAARALGRLISACSPDVRPLEYLGQLSYNGIRNTLMLAKAGQYERLTRAIIDSTRLNLRFCGLEDLEKVFGVGPKTARFFLLHSRPGMKLAVLDTHIRKWMRSHGVDIPDHMTRIKYLEFERIYLSLVDVYFPRMDLATVDLLIWCEMSGRFDNGDAFGFPEPVLPGVPIVEVDPL